MIYTKEKFKELWESNEDGGGLTWEDIADCAKDWRLYSRPKIRDMFEVRDKVIEAAGCEPIDDIDHNECVVCGEYGVAITGNADICPHCGYVYT